MRQQFLTFLAVIILVPVLPGCDRAMVYDEFKKQPDNTWSWSEPLEYSFEMNDTMGIYNFLIQLRHTTEYPLSNLYMFIDVAGPSGQTLRDTINFLLAENSGKWLGSGVGKTRSIAYMYRKNTRFPKPGMYSVTLEQAMRLEEVPVSEVGIRIEKSTP